MLRGQGPTALVQLLSLALLLDWRGESHALNAGAQWFQVVYFPPTPVLLKEKLWCLAWAHFVCSLAVAGMFLHPTLALAVLQLQGEQRRCCRSFLCPLRLGASSPAAAPSVSLFLRRDLTSALSQHRLSQADTISCVLFYPDL